MANLSTKLAKHHLIYQKKNLMWTQKHEKYLDNDDKSKSTGYQVQMLKALDNQTKWDM